jgi:hypothetical protein
MPPSDNESTGYRRAAGLLTEQLENEIFVLDPRAGCIHALNPTASALWRLLQEPATLAELVDDFSAAFPHEPRTKLVREIKSGLTSIRGKGLIERTEIEP